MQQVSLVEFRRNAAKVLRRVERGERLILTVRGRPVARIEQVEERSPGPNDPFLRLADHATEKGGNLTNEEIDRVVYGR